MPKAKEFEISRFIIMKRHFKSKQPACESNQYQFTFNDERET